MIFQDPMFKHVHVADIQKIRLFSAFTGEIIVENEEDLGKILKKVKNDKGIKRSNPAEIYFISTDGVFKTKFIMDLICSPLFKT